MKKRPSAYDAERLPWLALGVVVGFGVGLMAFGAEPAWYGEVVRVKDGDTLAVMREGKEVAVRLYGIDAPEKKQPFGEKAKQRASELCFGRVVAVEAQSTDRYGRTIARVRAGGVDVGGALLTDGLAWWYEKYAPKDAEYERLEAEARRARRGLWIDPQPVPPWEWRRK